MVEDAIECHLTVLEKHGDPIPEDVESFTMDMGDAKDALAFRVSVRAREAIRVA